MPHAPQSPVEVVALPSTPTLVELLESRPGAQCFWGPAGGVVGWGEAVRVSAPTWQEAFAGLDSALGKGDGPFPVSLATLTFDPARSQWPSTLIVPAEAVVVRDGTAWRVRVDGAAEPTPTFPIPHDVTDPDGSAYRAAVAGALELIRDQAADKLVMATREDRVVAGLDASAIALALARRHTTAWVYCVDQMVGASPEMLLRRRGTEVSSRVLAGTVDRRLPDAEALAARVFAPGEKNYREHLWAVESACDALAEVGTDVAADAPFPLVLPHVIHLASDVRAHVPADATLSSILGRLHPTAAVGGTPRASACERIAALEGFDRGRFAGPVGMVCADGDGEFAIALRGGQVWPEGGGITVCAGAGIVEGSIPDDEWLEVSAKLRPITEAVEASLGIDEGVQR